MQTPDIKQIITDYLTNRGYDGLYLDGECACEMGDLMPCVGGPLPYGTTPENCKPGYRTDCHCGEGCGFHIQPKPAPPITAGTGAESITDHYS